MNDQYKWGDDPGSAIEKAAGSPLAFRIEEETVAGYLIQLRSEIEKNAELARKIAEAQPAAAAKPSLIAACKHVKPGTEHLLERAVSMLLEELEQQRRAAPSLYLVSQKTGRSVMPISAKDVYTPPDFVGLDGELHKSGPVVHPGISSSLALAAYEAAKEQSMTSLFGQSLSHVHLTEPEQMVERARQKLSGVVEIGEVDGPWSDMEFGKEHVSGMEQAPNTAFHRVELFSSVIAKRVVSLCGKGGKCELGQIRSCRSPKHRWYALAVKFKRADASGS